MKKNPNMLFIFTDEQRFDTLGAYGNKIIKTPNLDRLAEKSALFKKAYVTQPVCTPSRGSIMTGLYPHNHGCTGNNIGPLEESKRTIPEMINGEVYKSSYIGKWHLGNEIKRQHGFDEWISITDAYRKYYTDESYKDKHSDYHEFLISNDFRPDVDKGDFMYFSRLFANNIPEQYSQPFFLAREAIRYIEENKDNPFLMYVNFYDPHFPCYSAFDDMYDPNEVVLPENFNCDIATDAPLKLKLKRRQLQDTPNVWAPYIMDDEMLWRKMIARYWGMVSLVDKYVGKILDSLKENGLENDTIVVFTSDHGDMMGDFKMLGKCVTYESCVKVPLLVSIPGVTDKKLTIDQPVSQVDIVPTLLDALGQKIPDGLDGKSLYPLIKEEENFKGDDVFIEWNGADGEKTWLEPYMDGEWKDAIDKVYGAYIRTVITDDGWKLSLSSAGEHELYNLNNDPLELVNLYFSGNNKDEIRRLTEKISKWQKDKNDMVNLNI